MLHSKLHRAWLIAVAVSGLFLPVAASAQWSAQPGETVRDGFGPARANGSASVCRGACGAGCPSTCRDSVRYECVAGSRMRRVKTHVCGTHQGCREHDDCLDACEQSGSQLDCDAKCHQEAVEKYGLENTTSWVGGRGPYDGSPITFEYTRDEPDALQPAFRCPDGAKLQCAGASAQCVSGGTAVEPVFDSYPAAGAGSMHVSRFRSGRLCAGRVCGQASDIEVSGEETCAGSACTRFGMEFDYRNADPSMPLECSVSTHGGNGDFVNNLIKKGLDAAPEDGEKSGMNEGMAGLLGVFKKVVEGVEAGQGVSMAPLGPDGKPIESQRVGTPPRSGPPPVPARVDLPTASGHLVVPMYQVAEGPTAGRAAVKEIRCSHKGVPVLETTFRLSFQD
jgi:hypothetical protein